jgi:hypothetical protein
LTIPVILQNSSDQKEVLYKKVNDIIAATRKSSVLSPYAMALCDIMTELIDGKDLRNTIEEVGLKYFKGSVKKMVMSNKEDPMVACYIDSSFPALLHFAYKYADSPE